MDKDKKLSDFMKEMGEGIRNRKGLTGVGGLHTP
jgi:hypothetical protein